MQDKSFEDLIASSLDTSLVNSEVDKRMTEIASENKAALSESVRTPTDTELKDMRAFIIDFKKKHPKASQRQIRRATQKHFNLKILDNAVQPEA